MGSIMFNTDTWLVDVPTKKSLAAEVTRSGDYVFIKYVKPQFGNYETFSVCRLYKTEQWAFPLCLKSWPWQGEFMNVLVKLKLMTKDRQAELVEIDKRKNLDWQRKDDAERLEEIGKRNGLNNLGTIAEQLRQTKGSI